MPAGFLARVLDDAEFACRKLASIPEILREDARREYESKYAQSSRDGNLWLLRLSDFAERQGARDYSLSDEELCERARMLACNPLTAGGRTESQIRRHLRRQQRRGIEMIAYKIGIVSARGQRYCSKQTIALRTQQLKRWDRFAQRTVLKRGEVEIRLSELRIGAASRRAAELYRMTKALQTVAEADGLKWSMWSPTAPPEFHPAPSFGACAWNDQLSPRDAHEWIGKRWCDIRADLAKQGIKLSGIRVVECHQDGCTHWHIAIYYRPEHAAAIRAAFRRRWPTEVGAREVVGDPAKGSFASYMFKYLCKFVGDATRLDGDDGRAARAVDAWRSTWGIREPLIYSPGAARPVTCL